MSPHFRIKKIRAGFYRIYWKQAYVHECVKEMPQKGYDWEDLDPRIEDQKYYEQFEDRVDTIYRFKNYKEGYWDAIETLRNRLYQLKHNKEFHDNALKAYQKMVVK